MEYSNNYLWFYCGLFCVCKVLNKYITQDNTTSLRLINLKMGGLTLQCADPTIYGPLLTPVKFFFSNMKRMKAHKILKEHLPLLGKWYNIKNLNKSHLMPLHKKKFQVVQHLSQRCFAVVGDIAEIDFGVKSPEVATRSVKVLIMKISLTVTHIFASQRMDPGSK